jgi:hypothetical protein
LGHSYTETVIEPTREAQGYTLYTCNVCGYSYKDNFVEYVPVPIFTVSDATGYRSKQIELKISVVDNPGIAAFVMGFDYDKSALTLESIVIESALGGMTVINKKAVWLGNGNLAFEGDFITLIFTVNADAAVSDYTVGLICSEGDIVNDNEDYLDFKTVCGTVTVKQIETAKKAHTYTDNYDATCNECGAERTPADHVYDDDQDTTCNECGAERVTYTPGELDGEEGVTAADAIYLLYYTLFGASRYPLA